ncbi:MAG: alpha-ketoglutarate-dependent dioxygenase AlkB [Rickettsiales bacterium]|nr:alpha-ketoglutarate-dependent dioxygenase AlkB [Rickettsiales bacterium]|tara:strand:- start:2030 stop:2632 length:603 start_codon:yes stop_codon:yes gene_type:complete
MNTAIQQALFDGNTSQRADIAGLSYLANFITKEEEAALIRTIDAQPWLNDLKRRVQHYGWKYDYKVRGISEDLRLGELPDWLAKYARRLHIEGYFSQRPDQVIVNEYLPGQGISPHTDCLPCFGDTIASLSLGSACVMDFTQDKQKVPQSLEPRSLVILSGDARYYWKHGIAARKTDSMDGIKVSRRRRLSLTFRTILNS